VLCCVVLYCIVLCCVGGGGCGQIFEKKEVVGEGEASVLSLSMEKELNLLVRTTPEVKAGRRSSSISSLFSAANFSASCFSLTFFVKEKVIRCCWC